MKAGDRLGRFVLLGELGQGSNGVVFRATDTALDQEVAVKVLHPWLTKEAAVKERFKRELVLARRVVHPAVCRLFDLHEEGDAFFLTMELVDGETLHQLVKRQGPLPPARAVAVLRAVCQALAAAHAAGVVHRDLKPSNIIVRPDDRQSSLAVRPAASPPITLLDFGTATAGDVSRLTRPGVAVGSMRFIAPEVFKGTQPTSATDIYAVGISGYFTLAGRLPFEPAQGVVEMLERIKTFRVTPLHELNPAIPEALSDVIRRAMDKDPATRTPRIEDVDAALATCLDGAAVVVVNTAPPGPVAMPAAWDDVISGPRAAAPAADHRAGTDPRGGGAWLPTLEDRAHTAPPTLDLPVPQSVLSDTAPAGADPPPDPPVDAFLAAPTAELPALPEPVPTSSSFPSAAALSSVPPADAQGQALTSARADSVVRDAPHDADRAAPVGASIEVAPELLAEATSTRVARHRGPDAIDSDDVEHTPVVRVRARVQDDPSGSVRLPRRFTPLQLGATAAFALVVVVAIAWAAGGDEDPPPAPAVAVAPPRGADPDAVVDDGLVAPDAAVAAPAAVAALDDAAADPDADPDGSSGDDVAGDVDADDGADEPLLERGAERGVERSASTGASDAARERRRAVRALSPALQATRVRMAERGLIPGDAPAADRAVARARTLAKRGKSAEAEAALVEANRAIDAVTFDRAFVMAKLVRFNAAFDRQKQEATRQKVEPVALEASTRFARGDYPGANAQLNQAFTLLRR